MKAITLHAPWGTLLHTRTRVDGRSWEAYDVHGHHPAVPCIDEASARATASRCSSQVTPWRARALPMVKGWETRSWACPPSIIGQRIAIHQAKRQPQWAQIGDYYVERYYENVQHTDECDCDYEGGVAPSCTRGATSRMVLTTPGPTLVADLPLGCIVASGVITHSLPIVDDGAARNCIDVRQKRRTGSLRMDDAEGRETIIVDITDQFPYGDFTPGRWAWELSDVAATTDRCPACWGSGSYPPLTRQLCRVCVGATICGPIPAKGAQRFWEWTP